MSKVHDTVHPDDMDMVNEAYLSMIREGFAEEIPSDEMVPNWSTYWLTSRPVIRRNAQTTKCRIVSNGSCPDQNDRSKTLNKMLMPGPNKLPHIMELIMRFMVVAHVFLIDIQKMFLSIRLELKSDQDMLRFMWGLPGETVRYYRMVVVTFGLISSPYQAISCLRDTAERNQSIYPLAAAIILLNTYMDDIASGAMTVAEGRTLIQEILEILASGGFKGHKISASEPSMLKDISEDQVDKSRVVSVLGLKLDHNTCEFLFDLDDKFQSYNAEAERITRRDVVSLASQIFDTQGFVSPYVMQYKKLLPLLWHNNTTWDENLIGKTTTDEQNNVVPDEVAREAVDRFKEWIKDVPRLKELRFSRYLPGDLEKIAIFGDASLTGIGVVAYLIKNDNGQRRSHIFYSKSTLMPKTLRPKALAKDALTIARAELIALVLCVKMSEYIRNTLKPAVTTKQVHIFTDSLLNLQRVQRGKGKCKPWEEKRVENILDNKGESSISFCPGVLNPADLPSRGCNLDELTDRLKFWKEGPEFLLKDQSEWPKQPSTQAKVFDESKVASTDPNAVSDLQIYYTQVLAEAAENAVELKAMAVQERLPEEPTTELLLEAISSPSKVRIILSSLMRWKRKSAGEQVQTGKMTKLEADEADLLIVRGAQAKHLTAEVELLKEAATCSRPTERIKMPKSSPLRDLPAYYDQKDKIIRLHSRLHKSAYLPHGFTNPAILPKGRAVERLVLEVHSNMMHASQRTVFNTLRKQYWVLGGWSYVKDLVRKLCKTARCR